MRRAFPAFSILALLAFAPACSSEDSESGMGDAFRATDINIQLAQADGGEEDGTILWEIVEAEVYEGLSTDGNLGLYIENNAVFTAQGEQTCVVNSPYLDTSLREVVAANGTDVLFTVWHGYVFEGEVDVKIANWGKMKKLFGEQLLFQFQANEVFLGEARDNYRLLSANGDIENSSDGRKLLITALITGECGASGMPGYTF